jgi:hypothetical protein
MAEKQIITKEDVGTISADVLTEPKAKLTTDDLIFGGVGLPNTTEITLKGERDLKAGDVIIVSDCGRTYTLKIIADPVPVVIKHTKIKFKVL